MFIYPIVSKSGTSKPTLAEHPVDYTQLMLASLSVAPSYLGAYTILRCVWLEFVIMGLGSLVKICLGSLSNTSKLL